MNDTTKKLKELDYRCRELIAEVTRKRSELDSLMSEALSALASAKGADKQDIQSLSDTFKSYLELK